MLETPRRRGIYQRGAVLGVAVLSVAALAGMGQGGQTYAAFSDFQVVGDNVAGAGVWGTDLPLVPTECSQAGFVPVNWFVITDEGSFWSNGIEPLAPVGPGIPGSTTNGAFHGTDGSDFVVNLGPRRTLHGIGGDDCIVAGAGADILHGGPGNDVLIGGKKQHSGEILLEAVALAAPEPLVDQGYLDGESGADLCVPGPSDVIVNCESLLGATSTAGPEETSIAEDPSAPGPSPSPPPEEPTHEPTKDPTQPSMPDPVALKEVPAEPTATVEPEPECDALTEPSPDECEPVAGGEAP